jgi:hypothetical protein
MRLQIRAAVYRDKAGFVLSRSDGRVRIFFEHRSAAERVRDKLKADPDYSVTMEDFRNG